MSLSRQVLSSPFDVPPRPRAEASKDAKGGESRIFFRQRILNPSTANTSENVTSAETEDQQPPGCILFDSRLIKGDVFANPIVTVTGQLQCNADEKNEAGRGASERGRRAVSTPPPVKGRHHVLVQTDYDEMAEAGLCAHSMTVTSCAQTVLQCWLQDQTIVGKEDVTSMGKKTDEHTQIFEHDSDCESLHDASNAQHQNL